MKPRRQAGAPRQGRANDRQPRAKKAGTRRCAGKARHLRQRSTACLPAIVVDAVATVRSCSWGAACRAERRRGRSVCGPTWPLLCQTTSPCIPLTPRVCQQSHTRTAGGLLETEEPRGGPPPGGCATPSARSRPQGDSSRQIGWPTQGAAGTSTQDQQQQAEHCTQRGRRVHPAGRGGWWRRCDMGRGGHALEPWPPLPPCVSQNYSSREGLK